MWRVIHRKSDGKSKFDMGPAIKSDFDIFIIMWPTCMPNNGSLKETKKEARTIKANENLAKTSVFVVWSPIVLFL